MSGAAMGLLGHAGPAGHLHESAAAQAVGTGLTPLWAVTAVLAVLTLASAAAFMTVLKRTSPHRPNRAETAQGGLGSSHLDAPAAPSGVQRRIETGTAANETVAVGANAPMTESVGLAMTAARHAS